jgi:hypothetical protein
LFLLVILIYQSIVSGEEENKHAVFVRKSTTTDTGIVGLAWHQTLGMPATGVTREAVMASKESH